MISELNSKEIEDFRGTIFDECLSWHRSVFSAV